MGCAKSKPKRNQPRQIDVYAQQRHNEPERNRAQENYASVRQARYDNVKQRREVHPWAPVERELQVKLAYRQSRSQSLKRSFSSVKEKCYDPRDKTLTFVDGDDDLDFLCEDFKSLRAKMSCGHAVTPMSLTNWCRRLLDDGECKFVCGQTDCNVEWPYEEVCKMALLTLRETEEFEKKMFNNAAKNYLDIKICPGCKCRVVRNDPNNLCVECSLCTADKNTTYRFCWQCLKEWKGPGPRSDRCDNDGCFNKELETLRRCPNTSFRDVKGISGCPSIRACPTCGFLVEHSRIQCKSIVCPRCKKKFCFVCLKFSRNCLALKAYEPCATGVAPRQTSIPVWKT